MLLNRWNAVAIAGLASALALLIASSILSTTSEETTSRGTLALLAKKTTWYERTAEQAERSRIHAHFDSVLTELDARDLSSLSVEERAARAALVRTLTGYNVRGVFPHNYDFAEAATPYFVDRKTGTLCAVAFLLESTGHRALVDRVARTNNNVWVSALAGDSEFTAWLSDHGLSLAEAARIQVPYVMTPTQQRQEAALALAAPLSMLASASTATWNAWGNANGHSRAGSIIGISAGVLAGAFNARFVSGRDNNNVVRGIATAGVAVGGLGIALSTRSLMHRSQYLAAKRESEAAGQPRRAAPDASVSPILPVGRTGGTGIAVSVRF